jgi:hypothetical protein
MIKIFDWNQQEPKPIVFQENAAMLITLADYVHNGLLDTEKAQSKFFFMASSPTFQTVNAFIQEIEDSLQILQKDSSTKKRKLSFPRPFPPEVLQTLDSSASSQVISFGFTFDLFFRFNRPNFYLRMLSLLKLSLRRPL